MKKIFNRGLRRKINHGLFDDCLLAGNEYRKVYSRYDISEGYALYPLYRAIQPVIKVEIPVIFYNTVGFKENLIKVDSNIINLTPIVGKVLIFIFIILIIFDIVMDLHFIGKIDYGNIIWKIVALFFILNCQIECNTVL
ncbi:hypothetical protein [Aerococcus urinaeequi]|uniref:hypothetical protein n=2 Tax=Aerococcus urinaeequi TaxID=51665 RepID=UPI0022E8ABB7|nr:hypothetical protein [Aerococcus urinaeequi]